MRVERWWSRTRKRPAPRAHECDGYCILAHTPSGARLQDMYQLTSRLSDGTYISVTAPGSEMAETAFGYLRGLVRATRPEVKEAETPQIKLVGQL